MFDEISPDINEEIYIFNPTQEDFTHNYDGKPYTIQSRQSGKFPRYIADHLAKHLKDKILSTHKGTVTQELVNETMKRIYL